MVFISNFIELFLLLLIVFYYLIMLEVKRTVTFRGSRRSIFLKFEFDVTHVVKMKVILYLIRCEKTVLLSRATHVKRGYVITIYYYVQKKLLKRHYYIRAKLEDV